MSEFNTKEMRKGFGSASGRNNQIMAYHNALNLACSKIDALRDEISELDKDLRGKKFMVVQCEASRHDNGTGCVCHLIETEVELEKPYQSPFAGTKSYHIKDSDKTVRLSELGLENRFK